MWPQVLDVLKRRSPAVWANVNTNSQLAGVEGNTVTLGFSQVGAMRNFVNGAKDAVVAAAIAEVLGGTWRVEAVVGNSGGPSSGAGAPAPGVRQGTAGRPVRAEAPAPQPVPQRTTAAAPAPSSAPRQAPAQRASVAPPPSEEPWPDAPPPDDDGPAPSGGPAPSAGLAAARSAARSAAQAGPRQTAQAGWPDSVPGRPSPVAEADEVDPDNDADADADALTGMALIQRELGGQIIGEIDHT
jgi:DNA polymerase-3 subunit gamma/tau